MKNDKPLIAGLLGFISTIPSEIITQVLVFLDIGKYSTYQLDSLLVTFNRPSIIMGLIVNLILGGFISIVFYYAINKIGQDYLVFKGLAAGLLSWTITELLFTMTVEGKFISIRPMNDYYLHLSGAIVFGITLGLLFKKYFLKEPIEID